MAATLRVLTWNLFHGRARPPAGHSLLGEFGAALAGWDWDVALLQEVPHWWASKLGEATGSQPARALTARNWVPPLQRLLAERFPDALKSGAGGSNVILTRSQSTDHRRRRLRFWPERRTVHGVRLASGVGVANLHATAHDPPRAAIDIERARRAAIEWAAGAPVVMGGDLNEPRPRMAGFVHADGSNVDHVFARGLEPAGPADELERGHLSDHAPLAVALRLTEDQPM